MSGMQPAMWPKKCPPGAPFRGRVWPVQKELMKADFVLKWNHIVVWRTLYFGYFSEMQYLLKFSLLL